MAYTSRPEERRFGDAPEERTGPADPQESPPDDLPIRRGASPETRTVSDSEAAGLAPTRIELHPVVVRVGSTLHLCAQVVNSVTGKRGPLLSSERCNLDDTLADTTAIDYNGGDRCGICWKPVVGDE